MRPATLCKALLLLCVIAPVSVPANASHGQQFDFFLPSTSVEKPVVTKRAKANQVIREHTLEYDPVDGTRVERPIQGQRQRGAKRSRQGAPHSTPQINFFAIWQTWTAPVAHSQPRVQRGRAARSAHGSVPRHRIDLSSEYPIERQALLAHSKSQRSPQPAASAALIGPSDIVSEARRWMGTNPTNMPRLWCARFMNFVLQRSGYSGTGSDAARSFVTYGHILPGPQVGAIVVLSRGRNGGHVGIVTGIDRSGNPIVISGNHRRKVGEGVYSRSRVLAYVRPI